MSDELKTRLAGRPKKTGRFVKRSTWKRNPDKYEVVEVWW